MLLMNLVTNRSWYFGSGRTSRRRTSPLRGIRSQISSLRYAKPKAGRRPIHPWFRTYGVAAPPHARTTRRRLAMADPRPPIAAGDLLRPLCSVFRAASLAVLHADRVQSAAHDV